MKTNTKNYNLLGTFHYYTGWWRFGLKMVIVVSICLLGALSYGGVYAGYCSSSTWISCSSNADCPDAVYECSNDSSACTVDADCDGGASCTNPGKAGNSCTNNSSCDVTQGVRRCDNDSANAGASCSSDSDCQSLQPALVGDCWVYVNGSLANWEPGGIDSCNSDDDCPVSSTRGQSQIDFFCSANPSDCTFGCSYPEPDCGYQTIVTEPGVCTDNPDGTCDFVSPAETCINEVQGSCEEYPASYASQPATNTANGCAAGTYTDLADSGSQWIWRCEGIDGGTDETCYANIATVNGQCVTYGSTYASQPATDDVSGCVQGTYNDTSDAGSNRQWECVGANGGSTANCAAVMAAVNGSCTTYPAAYATQPGTDTASGCDAGTYVDAGDTASEWRWQCQGLNGGTYDECAASKSVTCSLRKEAEDATTIGSEWFVASDLSASNDSYLDNQGASESNGVARTDPSFLAVFSENISYTGTYFVRARIRVYSTSDDEVRFWLENDSPEKFIASPTDGLFNWHLIKTRALYPGTVDLTFSISDDQVDIDKILLTTDNTFTPTGEGSSGNTCVIQNNVYSCDANGAWSLVTANGCPTITYDGGTTYAATQNVCNDVLPASTTCVVCGDAENETGEACDDGNANNNDSCTTSCVSATCGDGFTRNTDGGAEECDDGNATETDGCKTDCTLPVCGDGIVNSSSGGGSINGLCGENLFTCTQGTVINMAQGNSIPCYAVSWQCQGVDGGTTANCGGDNCTYGTCSDGIDNNGDGLTDCDDTSCQVPLTGCPIGGGNEVEECDDGNLDNTDDCTTSCKTPICGDGYIHTGFEECDDGPSNSNTLADTCRTTCENPTCGDGVTDTGEACDDGASNSDAVADACRTDCSNPTCGDGVTDTGETCDDGVGNGTLGNCNATCDGITSSVCGNGTTEGAEECDGQTGCAVDCTWDEVTCALSSGGNTGSVSVNINQPIVFSMNISDVVGDPTSFGTTRLNFGDGTDGAPAASPSHTYIKTGTFTVSYTVFNKGVTVDPGSPIYPRVRKTCSIDVTVLPPLCGNGSIDAGEQCGEPGLSCGGSGVCNPVLCQCQSVCGQTSSDEAAEECDNAGLNNDANSDACRTSCLDAYCGDGVVDSGEACDDGPDNGKPTFCNSICSGITPGTCGNAIVEVGEECDNGPSNSNTASDACRTDCLNAYCGDGVSDTGESCDDGNLINTDGCTTACELPACGDGFVQVGEACDDGVANSDATPNACRTDCTDPICGDGVVDSGEGCDDGDNDNTDGCTNACELPACGDGFVQAGEACDDGASNSDTNVDACRTDCSNPTCGDGVVDTGEVCDDGANNGNLGFCNATCDAQMAAVCGDGTIEYGEECDGQLGCDTDTCLWKEATCAISDIYGNTGSVTYFVDQWISFALTYPSGNDMVVTKLNYGDGQDAAVSSVMSHVFNTIGTYPVQFSVLNKGVVATTGAVADRVSETCTINVSVIEPTCGNGVVNVGESCGEPGLSCTGGLVCNPYSCQCQNVCTEIVFEVIEECDDGNVAGGDGCSNVCQDEFCGDGVVDPDGIDNILGNDDDEVCDAGADNGIVGGTCSGTCRLPGCGDGIVATGEACDPGSYCADGTTECTNDPGICPTGLTECKPRTVGTCNELCQRITICGDGIIQPLGTDGIVGTSDDEECDDVLTTDACDTEGVNPQGNGRCTLTFCGDGTRQPVNGQGGTEQCDDGNLDDFDGCSNGCILSGADLSGECFPFNPVDYYSLSGNNASGGPVGLLCIAGTPSIVDYDDTDGSEKREWTCTGVGAGSTADCELDEWFCGDGFVDVDAGEECDDGNQVNGDGCSSSCTQEAVLDPFDSYSGSCVSEYLPTVQIDEILPVWMQLQPAGNLVENTSDCAQLESNNTPGIPEDSVYCTFRLFHGRGEASGGDITVPCMNEPAELADGSDLMLDAISDFIGTGVVASEVVGSFFIEDIAQRIKEKDTPGEDIFGQYSLILTDVSYEYCGRLRPTDSNPSPGFVTLSGTYAPLPEVCGANLTITPPYFVQKGTTLFEVENTELGTFVSVSGNTLITDATPFDPDNNVSTLFSGPAKEYFVNEFVTEYTEKAVIEELITVNGVQRTFMKVPNERVWIYMPSDSASYVTYGPGVEATNPQTNLVLAQEDIEAIIEDPDIVDDIEEPFTIITVGSNLIFNGSIGGKGFYLSERDIFFSAYGDSDNCDDTDVINGVFVIYGGKFCSDGRECTNNESICGSCDSGRFRTSRVRNDSLTNTEYCKGGNLVVRGTLLGNMGANFEDNRRSVLDAWDTSSYFFSTVLNANDTGNVAELVPEDCTDNIDNDGDGWIDCADASDCTCTLPSMGTENSAADCMDNIDNDGDKAIDCYDSECKGFPNCKSPVGGSELICGDGIDNDGDRLVDCADSDCQWIDNCELDAAASSELDGAGRCGDGIDNDSDGKIDCADSDCVGLCPEDVGPTVETNCTDNIDNDGNGLVDCSDEPCKSSELHCQPEAPKNEICADNIDNDGDGYVDCADLSSNVDNIGRTCDTSCPIDETPLRESEIPGGCEDGLDNDNDGMIDCRDDNDPGQCNDGSVCTSNADCIPVGGKCTFSSCRSAPNCVMDMPPAEICDDGIDNDLDGLIDCADNVGGDASACLYSDGSVIPGKNPACEPGVGTGSAFLCISNSECDDGIFCNGYETCDIGSGECLSSTNPVSETGCNPANSQECNEDIQGCATPQDMMRGLLFECYMKKVGDYFAADTTGLPNNCMIDTIQPLQSLPAFPDSNVTLVMNELEPLFLEMKYVHIDLYLQSKFGAAVYLDPVHYEEMKNHNELPYEKALGLFEYCYREPLTANLEPYYGGPGSFSVKTAVFDSYCLSSSINPWPTQTAINPYAPTNGVPTDQIQNIANEINNYRMRFLDFDFELTNDSSSVGLLVGMSVDINAIPFHAQFINDPITEEYKCDDGLDGDMDGLVDCADNRCATNASNCLGEPVEKVELCYDGQDNDLDGKVDCDDSECSGLPACSNGPSTPETCYNEYDDADGDGYDGCSDGDCVGILGCETGGPVPNDGFCQAGEDHISSPTDCQDCSQRNVDTDGDGAIDACAEYECAFANECFNDPGASCGNGTCDAGEDGISCRADCEVCDDGVDNENLPQNGGGGDGLKDCSDPDCSEHPHCVLSSPFCNNNGVCDENEVGGTCSDCENLCGDGVSNDQDAFIDCADFECIDKTQCNDPGVACGNGVCAESERGRCAADCETICDDGTSNDQDALVDCQDIDCAFAASPCMNAPLCGNGICNTSNYEHIVASPYFCAADCEICNDGIDNESIAEFGGNGDGLIDCADPECGTNPACNLPSAACGNGICESFEDSSSCAADCEDCLSPGDDEVLSGSVGDGYINCADQECKNDAVACYLSLVCNLNSICEAGETGGVCSDCGEVCGNTIDDDGDGLADCVDPQCEFHSSCRTDPVSTPSEATYIRRSRSTRLIEGSSLRVEAFPEIWTNAPPGLANFLRTINVERQ